MRNLRLAVLVAIAVASVGLHAQSAKLAPLSPQVMRMDPKTVKPGTVVTITGTALGRNMVDEVYLTDHVFDLKVKVLEQGDQQMKIRVPPFVKPGRLQLLMLTKGDGAAYLEQPVFVMVEFDEEARADKPAAPVDKTTGNHPDK
jgi:hypothetical protein